MFGSVVLDCGLVRPGLCFGFGLGFCWLWFVFLWYLFGLVVVVRCYAVVLGNLVLVVCGWFAFGWCCDGLAVGCLVCVLVAFCGWVCV